jgi:CO/xanthine dehydrogenase Mo-binding subunit
LTEEVILEKGITITPSFSEYLLSTAMDVPDVQTILLESGDGVGPFGAKGVGEPSVCSVAPAIANAVFDAVGVRIYDLPITPEKVLKAIQEKKNHSQS